jgi:phosphate transport system protein
MCCALSDGHRPSVAQLECLEGMAELADEQLADATRTFAERDAEGVERLRAGDAAINERNRRCFALGLAEARNRGDHKTAFFVALMARAIERIGDNSVDRRRSWPRGDCGRPSGPSTRHPAP